MSKHMDKFDEFKRQAYLLIIPVLIIALFIDYIFLIDHAHIHHMIIIGLIGCLTVSWVLIYINYAFRIVELSNLIFLTLLEFIKFYHVIRYNIIQDGSIEIGELLWTPLFFMYIFFSMKDKKGLIYSIIIIVATIVIGGYYNSFVNEHLNLLIQFYISNIIYVAVLYISLHLIKVYSDSEALLKLAYEDFLTELPNRHKLTLCLSDSIEKYSKQNISFSIIFFDIDRFKDINDQLGHDVGDSVLIEMAKVIKICLLKNEFYGRWGGDEFMVIVSHPSDAQYVAEKLRKRIEQYRFTNIGEVTCSFGVTTYVLGDTEDNILKRADNALYKSKKAGCNKVSVI